MTRAVLDVGGLCFGTSVFLSPENIWKKELVAIGCGLFGFAAVLDLLGWIILGSTI